jgi:tRNA-Thr(GGU) m(6)t(6)A37 methyltransferase TsaA
VELRLEPIGVVHSPFRERREAPRQPAAARDVRGTIELFSGRGFEYALEDLESFSHVWVLFWFHLNEGWRPKVLPPRSKTRRGVFATRAPYRPNPIGLSVVKLEAVEGLRLEVSGIDILDQSPVLDLKPYVAYTDSLTDATSGWLEERDPIEPYRVEFAELADEELRYLELSFGIALRDAIRKVLELGPEQHPYRRIRRDGDELVLAVKDWRARFRVDGRRILVQSLVTGYRPKQLALDPSPELDPHRAFVERFGHGV